MQVVVEEFCVVWPIGRWLRANCMGATIEGDITSWRELLEHGTRKGLHDIGCKWLVSQQIG